MRSLAGKLKNGDFEGCTRMFEKVMLPMLDYVTLAGKEQLQNKRNTISYDKEHKRDVLDNALEVYEAFASQLQWTDYFRLIKVYLYKLQRAETQVHKVKMNAGQGDPELQKEKIITKVICKILNGFHFEEVPDAIEELIKEQGQQPEEKGS